MTDITISVFVFSSSTLSFGDSKIDLYSKISKEIPKTLSELGYNCVLRPPIIDGNQYDMLKACMEDDIVIFDGSIEKDENGNWDSNYAAATANAMAMDNVLVVSRTRLPFNYQALRTNVPELGQEKRDNYGNPCYEYSNDDIILWMKSELEKMSKPSIVMKENGSTIELQPRLPVPDRFKMIIPPLDKLGNVMNDLFSKQNDRMKDSIEFMNSIRKRGAFISYRSHYYNEKYYGINAGEDLVKIIKDRHNDENYPVTIYAEGEIASEFMTEQKRWGVEKFVDNKLRNVDEVWIFETGDEDGFGYYDSWWTCGEIISLMYMKACGYTLPKIYVCRYDNDSQTLIIPTKEEDDNYIPNLTNELLRELARYFANADGANEMMSNMRDLRKKSIIVQRLAYYSMKKLERAILPKELQDTAKEENGFKAYKESLYSHVYDESFTDNHIAFCPPNKKVSKPITIKDFENPKFIWNFIRINSEMENGAFKEEVEQRGYFSITPEEMKEIIKNKQWICKKMNNRIIKIKEAAHPIFQWWPIRRGQKTGPSGVIIEPTTNWLIESINN